MKNLKKVLALVLTVALVLSITMIAGAAFTDTTTYTANTEAVDVMTLLKVINGYTDGTFRGDKSVTRAEMAKMICYIVSGGDDVGSIYAGANTFTDCTSHWAKGYIAYAAKTGLVAGIGKGKFDPNGNVTGTQAAKMLLCALGYNATNEKYVGANWDVNVLAKADEIGLLDDLTATNMSIALTRADAAQMMFNALKGTMVKYTSGGTTVTTKDGTVVTTGASTAEEVANKTFDYRETTASAATLASGTMQLCEKYFKDLKLATSSDDFMRPADKWTYTDNKSVTAPSSAKVTYTAETTGKTIYNDLSKDTVNKIKTVEAYRNGQSLTAGSAAADLAWFKANITSSNTSDVTENGMSVEIYIDDTDAKIIIVDTVLAQVSSINSKDKDNLKAKFTGKVAFNELTEEDSGLDLSKLTEDEYVLVTGVKNGATYDVKSITVPTAVAGAMSSRKTTSTGAYITVAGTKYAINMKNFNDVDGILTTSNYDNTYTVYTDGKTTAYGAVLKDEAATSNTYLYVTDNDADKYGAISGNAYAKVAATFTDGTSKVVSLYVKDAAKTSATVTISGTEYEFDTQVNDIKSALANGWYSYTVNSDGLYKLTKVTDTTYGSGIIAFTGTCDNLVYSTSKASIAFGTTLAGSTTSTGTVMATSTTTLNLVDSAKTYTGYKNFVDYTDIKAPTSSSKAAMSVLYVMASKGSNTVKAIYVKGDDGVTTKTTIAYLGDLIGSDTNGNKYEFYVDGASKEYYVATIGSFVKGNIVSLSLDGDNATLKDIATVDFSGADAPGKYMVMKGVEVSKIEGTDYFEATKSSTTYTFYNENSDKDIKLAVYNADDGKTATLSKYDTVDVVYVVIGGANYAVAAYIQ